MLATLTSAFDLLLVIVGFGLVIFVHELGHFLAARWAGVRVEQFALGFGTAALSYRRGVGLCRGSTRAKLEKMIAAQRAASGAPGITPGITPGVIFKERVGSSAVGLPPGVGATEYRLNWFPLGGYVKMLGQDDLHATPSMIASMPDSYPAASTGKRMVIISAGVVMNVILAAALFVGVFMVGLRMESPVVGFVAPGGPAATAKALEPGVAPGLEPGDAIQRVGSRGVRSFNDIVLAVAMSEKGEPLPIEVKRGGKTLKFLAGAKADKGTGLLDLGLLPASSTTLLSARDASAAAVEGAKREFERIGLAGVDFGATLTAIDGVTPEYAHDLERAVASAKGRPVRARFESKDHKTTEVSLAALPELQVTRIRADETTAWPVAHTLGLMAPIQVGAIDAQVAETSGLRPGDLLARVGATEWPDPASAIREIRKSARKQIEITALRDGKYVALKPRVTDKGSIGFISRAALEARADAPGVVVAGALTRRHAVGEFVGSVEGETVETGAGDAPTPALPGLDAAERLDLPPGSIVLRVGGVEVHSFYDLREALRAATADALKSGSDASVPLLIRLPLGEAFGAGPEESLAWKLTRDDVGALHALGWRSPVDQNVFELAKVKLKATGPLSAVGMGVRETQRVMTTTYVTIRRLFEGSVKVEHLKGPVGIAHLGTMVASQGFLQLLFFLALISVNLAVLNFLPLPIVDGGQFVFLLWEAATGKPVSAAVQQATIIAGVVMIGAVFLIVTFNDVANLIGK